MQFTPFAVGIDAAVVVDAIGKVRIFLHFEDDHVWADGVLSSCRDEESITRRYRMALEEVFERVILEPCEKRVFRRTRLKTKKQRSVGSCRDDVPHFGFAAAAGGLFVSGGVVIA